MRVYIVQQGDTLWKIAKQHNVNFEQLKKMNSQLANPDMLMPGMEIILPDTDCQHDEPSFVAPQMDWPQSMPHMHPMPHMHHMMEPMQMMPCFICQMVPMPMPQPQPFPQGMPWQQQPMPMPMPWPPPTQVQPWQQPCGGAGCGGDSNIDRQYYEQIRALEQQAMPATPPHHSSPFW